MHVLIVFHGEGQILMQGRNCYGLSQIHVQLFLTKPGMSRKGLLILGIFPGITETIFNRLGNYSG